MGVSGSTWFGSTNITMAFFTTFCVAVVLVVAANDQSDSNPNELDKLYSRMNAVLAQIQGFEEQMDALSAELSVQEKRLKDLTQIKFVELAEVDAKQAAALNTVNSNIDDLTADTNDLTNGIDNLAASNDDNTAEQETAQNLFASDRATDIWQDNQVNKLYPAVKDYKDKLFNVKSNEFAVFEDTVGRDTTTLASVNARETRRMCEVGRVTLTSVDKRVEYQYQTTFENTPGITYGLCGFNFNLNSREASPSYYYQEPEALGARVNAYSSPTGITIEAFDLSFGDSSAVSVDVCFQACSIGPGTEPVSH